MATSAVLRYNMNKITCYLDHARVAQCSASSGFNSVGQRTASVINIWCVQNHRFWPNGFYNREEPHCGESQFLLQCKKQHQWREF
jgi:hypothetical protein